MTRRIAVDPQFPARLRELRKARNLSQEELAGVASVSESHISELENSVKTPSATTARSLDTALVAEGELVRLVTDPYASCAVVDSRFPARLQELRIARGLSMRELARRVPCTHVHIIGMEKGTNAPSPSMVARLSEVLGDAELAAPVANVQTPESVANRREEEDTDRRQVLTTGTGLAAAAALDTSQPHILGANRLSLLDSLPSDPDMLEDGLDTEVGAYGELSKRLWRLYWDAPTKPLFEAAYAQVRMGATLLGGISGGDRSRISGGLALAALLAFRLAFFDLNRPGAAARCEQVALSAANEAGDHAMVAVVLGHMSFRPAFAGDAEQAERLVSHALDSAQHAGPLVSSWLHCVASEANARSGNGPASQRQTELAEQAFGADERVPEWFDFYNYARFSCFAGYAATVAGDHSLAIDRLSRALVELGPNGSKQRSVVHADLAIASQGDADQTAHYLQKAIGALEVSWYEVGVDRVRRARTLLGDSQLGLQVDERLTVVSRAER